MRYRRRTKGVSEPLSVWWSRERGMRRKSWMRGERGEVIKAGKEALRVDIDDILTSELLNALTTYH
jgi:hypothetical protein